MNGEERDADTAWQEVRWLERLVSDAPRRRRWSRMALRLSSGVLLTVMAVGMVADLADAALPRPVAVAGAVVSVLGAPTWLLSLVVWYRTL
jgi:hypothetical protein